MRLNASNPGWRLDLPPPPPPAARVYIEARTQK